jgi:hypothetical protein
MGQYTRLRRLDDLRPELELWASVAMLSTLPLYR